MGTLEKICRACGRPRPASEDFCPYCTAPPTPRPVRNRSQDATVDTGLQTRWGGGQRNPTIDEMRAALTELDKPDEEHPDTWLEDDSGRVVIAYESGLVIFADSMTEICRRQGVTRGEALQLWLLLQRGRYDEIRQRLSA